MQEGKEFTTKKPHNEAGRVLIRLKREILTMQSQRK